MPRLSVRAVIINRGEILLSKYEDDRGYWYVTPGGGVENGETIEEAFHREMLEEIGQTPPFGEILFVREVIADRIPDSYLKPGFHQVEIFIASELDRSLPISSKVPDTGQIGVEWLPLAALDQIRFFPLGLVKEFQSQNWDKTYYGNLR